MNDQETIKTRFQRGPSSTVGGFETAEVPFIKVDNRRCLAMWQLAEKPWLGEFMRRFQECFEFDPHREVWWFND